MSFTRSAPFQGPTPDVIGDLAVHGLQSVAPSTWGVRVGIDISGFLDELDRLIAASTVLGSGIIGGHMEMFTQFAMAAHKQRVLDMLDGIDVPANYENRGRYGYLKRQGILRVAKQSGAGDLLTVPSSSTQPLSPITGELRNGIAEAKPISSGKGDIAGGLFRASIEYTRPVYLEAILRGHRGRFFSEAQAIYYRRMFKRLGVDVPSASMQVPARPFITDAWAQIQGDLQVAFEAVVRQIGADFQRILAARPRTRIDPDRLLEFLWDLPGTAILGFTARHTNNVAVIANQHMTQVDVGSDSESIVELQRQVEKFSSSMRSRARAMIGKLRGKTVTIGPPPGGVQRTSAVFVLTDRPAFRAFLRERINTPTLINADVMKMWLNRLELGMRQISTSIELQKLLVGDPNQVVIYANSALTAAGNILAFGERFLNAAARGGRVPGRPGGVRTVPGKVTAAPKPVTRPSKGRGGGVGPLAPPTLGELGGITMGLTLAAPTLGNLTTISIGSNVNSSLGLGKIRGFSRSL